MQEPSETSAPSKKDWNVVIYPVLAWAPVLGVSVNLPNLPDQPSGTPGPSGSTSTSFNGAYFGGAHIEIKKWSADALFMYAGLSASRSNPFVKVDMDFVFGQAMAGYEVLPHLFLEGGTRRIALDFTATVGNDSVGRSPGFWDPLVGLTYRRPLSKKWRVMLHGDGGGFGVGSEVDVAATGRAEWQFARHFGLTFGYGGLHLRESDTVARKTLTISPTMHGPIIGFGVFF
jgi:hypothetical protein